MRQPTSNKLIYPELSYTVCGLCFQVHNELGRYRNEKQYGDALEVILSKKQIPYKREKILESSFEGEKKRNIVDFIIEDKLILELKCKRIVGREDYYQVIRYLVSCDVQLGIIVNFRDQYLKPKRILHPNF